MSPDGHRPTADELVAAVVEFLDGDVRATTEGAVNFHARVAANALRIVERELRAAETAGTAQPDLLGFADEAGLAAAIRAGALDDRADAVTACLRQLVRQRIAIDHPGYEHE